MCPTETGLSVFVPENFTSKCTFSVFRSSFCNETVHLCFSPCFAASVSPGCANGKWYLDSCASFLVPGLLLLLSSVQDQLCVMQFTRPPTLPGWLDCTLLSLRLTSLWLPVMPSFKDRLPPSHTFLKLCPGFVFSTFWLLILFLPNTIK